MQVVLFAVPGAFTPTCSLKHLPGFIEKADMLKVVKNLSFHGVAMRIDVLPKLGMMLAMAGCGMLLSLFRMSSFIISSQPLHPAVAGVAACGGPGSTCAECWALPRLGTTRIAAADTIQI